MYKWDSFGHRQPGSFSHINLLIPNSPPLEALHQCAQSEADDLHGKTLTWALPPAHPKRQHPFAVALPALEPLR
jgi:hypothetical protein